MSLPRHFQVDVYDGLLLLLQLFRARLQMGLLLRARRMFLLFCWGACHWSSLTNALQRDRGVVGHAYLVFTSSPMGQSLHGSLQLLSPDMHREICVLLRSVWMYFVRVHCHHVFCFVQAHRYSSAKLCLQVRYERFCLCWDIICYHVNLSDIYDFVVGLYAQCRELFEFMYNIHIYI